MDNAYFSSIGFMSKREREREWERERERARESVCHLHIAVEMLCYSDAIKIIKTKVFDWINKKISIIRYSIWFSN